MRIALAWPLDPDELVAFELVTGDGSCGTGQARVAWKQGKGMHGMRFERLTPAARDMVLATATAPSLLCRPWLRRGG